MTGPGCELCAFQYIHTHTLPFTSNAFKICTRTSVSAVRLESEKWGGHQSPIPVVSHSISNDCESPLTGEDYRVNSARERGKLDLFRESRIKSCGLQQLSHKIMYSTPKSSVLPNSSNMIRMGGGVLIILYAIVICFPIFHP